jgi:ATP-binding cassette subfamily C (CFTR/MRP) protein 1
VGIFTLLTLGVLVVVLPIVGGLGSRFGPLRKVIAAISDIRLKYTNEVLNNIKTVKFYAWEDSFKRRIYQTRGVELGRILKMLFVRSFIFIFMANTTTICIGMYC